MGDKVGFRLGAQANLPARGTKGTFYLTNDTNRLYFAKDNNQDLVLLNQTVQIVPSISDLTLISDTWTTTAAKEAHVNDFYYITGNGQNGNYSNILVVWTQSSTGVFEWKQINADHNTIVANAGFTATASSNVGNIELEIGNDDNSSVTANFSISATGSASVTANSNGLVIKGAEYSLTNKIDNAMGTSTDVYLAVDGSTANGSKITISAASNSPIQIQGINGGIVLDSTNTYNATANFTIPSSGSLEVSITDSENGSVTASVSNVGILLNNDTYVPIASTAGKTAGAIYSKTEIDNMFNGLDGMTYKGTLGSSGSVQTLPSTGVKNGDTYVIVQPGATAGDAIFDGATFNSTTLATLTNTVVGDMVIASGTETNGVISSGLQWTYVPSGNDSLDNVTYSAVVDDTTHTIQLENVNHLIVAQNSLVAGTDMALSSAVSTPSGGNTNSALTTTINHATISTSSTTAASLSTETTSFTAIKGITVSNGHVTGIETDVFTPVTYAISNPVVTEGTRTATATNSGFNDVTAAISMLDSANTPAGTATLKLSSDSLIVSAGTATNEIKVDLEWGTF